MVCLGKFLSLPLALTATLASASPVDESTANTLADIPGPAPLNEVIEYLNRARASSEERKLFAILRAANDLQAAKDVLGLDSAAAEAAEESQLVARTSTGTVSQAAQPSADSEIFAVPGSSMASLIDAVMDKLAREGASPREKGVADVLRATFNDAAPKAEEPGNAKGLDSEVLEKRMKKGSAKHILCCIFTLGLCPGGPPCKV